jgi:hypothetical protein
MGKRRDIYRVLMRKPEGKGPHRRPRNRRDDDIKIDLQEVGCGRMDWIEMAQDRGKCWALVSEAMKYNAGNFLTSRETVSFSRSFSMEKVSSVRRTSTNY